MTSGNTLLSSRSIVLNHDLCRRNSRWDEPRAVLPVDQRKTTHTHTCIRWSVSQETTMTRQYKKEVSPEKKTHRHLAFSSKFLLTNYVTNTLLFYNFLFWYFEIKADIYWPTRLSGHCFLMRLSSLPLLTYTNVSSSFGSIYCDFLLFFKGQTTAADTVQAKSSFGE